MAQTIPNERRRATRVAVDLQAVDTTHAHPLHVRDLSLGGARCTTTRRYAVGSSLDVVIGLPGSPEPVRLEGAVAASSDATVQIRFVKPRKRDLVRLAEALW